MSSKLWRLAKPRNSGPNTGSTRFKPGNPGKPRGARNRATILAEQLMRDDEEGVVQAVITAAKAGDMTAARLVLDRIAPVRKGRPVPINLPVVDTAADVNTAMSAIVAQMAAGDLTAEEASTIVGVLEAKRKAIETHDHEQRIAALELAKEGKAA